jgi:alpha-L-arabinofuranosidase
LFVVNRHDKDPIRARVILDGFKATASAELQLLTGSSFMAKNEWNETAVKPIAKEVVIRDGGLDHSLPPLSLSRFTFRLDLEEH